MHERTRRQICRLVFLALCVAPTCVSLTCVAYRYSPLYAQAEKQAWQSELELATGLLASIDQVQHPAGAIALLTGVELTDPDGDVRVARIRQIELARAPQGMLIRLSQPEIMQGKFLRLWDVLHDRVLKGPAPKTPVQITSEELTLEVGRRAQTFTRVHCTVEPYETGVRAWVDFQLAGVDMPAPAQLLIERNRQTLPPSTRWQLQTATPIPCTLFTDYLPALTRLGDKCEFQGELAAASAREGWSAELTGRLTQVDLDAATASFPYKLSGLATLNVRRAAIVQGRLSEAAGTLHSPGGVVSQSLVRSLAEFVSLAMPESLRQWPQTYIPYDQLGFHFAITGAHVHLTGACVDAPPQTLFVSRGGFIALPDGTPGYPVVSLVRAFSPGSDALVPATDQASQLLSLLVLPDPRTPGATIVRQPEAKVRLR